MRAATVGMLAEEPRDASCAALVDPERALDGREPGRAEPAIDAAEQRLERAEHRARLAIGQRVAVAADQRERLAGDGTQCAGERGRRERRGGEIARECLRGGVRGGLRERRAIILGGLAEHDLEPACDQGVAAGELVGDVEARGRALAQLAELAEQRVELAAATGLGREPGEPLRVELDRRGLAECARDQAALGRGRHEIGDDPRHPAREGRCTDRDALAERGLDHVDRRRRHCESAARDRGVGVAVGRAHLDPPQLLEPAPMVAGGKQRARRREPGDGTGRTAAEAELGPREWGLVFAPERDERVEEDRDVGRVAGLDPAEALDRARLVAAEVALSRVAPRDVARVLAPRGQDPGVRGPRGLAPFEPVRAQRDRLVEPARVEQGARRAQIDQDLIGIPGQARVHRAAVQARRPQRLVEPRTLAIGLLEQVQQREVRAWILTVERDAALDEPQGLVDAATLREAIAGSLQRLECGRPAQRGHARGCDGLELGGRGKRGEWIRAGLVVGREFLVRSRPARRARDHLAQQREVRALGRRLFEAREQCLRMIGIDREHVLGELLAQRELEQP